MKANNLSKSRSPSKSRSASPSTPLLLPFKLDLPKKWECEYCKTKNENNTS